MEKKKNDKNWLKTNVEKKKKNVWVSLKAWTEGLCKETTSYRNTENYPVPPCCKQTRHR